MAVVPGRTGFLGHDLDMVMAFGKLDAAKIGRGFKLELATLALTVITLQIENAGAVLVISDPCGEPVAAIGTFHWEKSSIASPRLHMNPTLDLELFLRQVALLLPRYARLANTFQANQFHAAAANVDVLHHFPARGEIGDMLAMTAGGRMRLDLAEYGIKIGIDPARLDQQLRHGLPFDEGYIPDRRPGKTGGNTTDPKADTVAADVGDDDIVAVVKRAPAIRTALVDRP
jgi:hypothetical protein